MENENSSNHWGYFNTKNHNVLDLGCGRWRNEVFEELSPIYFKNKGANIVVGVDSCPDEIEFYQNNMSDGYVFIRLNIDSASVIKNLIDEHSITAIKCDIEGNEKFLLDLTANDLSKIDEFAVEFHTTELMEQFIQKMGEWGFTIKHYLKHKFGPNSLGVLFGERSISKFNEKICVCYTPCGPTYRKTTLDKLNSIYFDDPNICYSVITDDKEYFKDVKLKNFIVKDLKDFYDEFPHVEEYEAFLESDSVDDYAEKVVKPRYLFSFSSMRFHLLHAKEFGATNVALLCTDSTLNFSQIDDDFLSKKDMIYNAVSIWPIPSTEHKTKIVVDMLSEKYSLNTDKEFMVYDAAARFFVFKNLDKMSGFFKIWHDIITDLYLTGKITHFTGWIMYNDEHILAPIYNVFDMVGPDDFTICNRLFDVKHNKEEERFWAV